MNLQENNHPIDELFRQTFKEMPPQPDPSGWDKPSERVWEGIQNGIKPAPATGISRIALWGGAIALVAGGILLWTMLLKPQPAQQQPILQPTESAPENNPATPTATPDPVPSTAVPEKTENKKPVVKPEISKTPKVVPDNTEPAAPPAAPVNKAVDSAPTKPGRSIPLPGTATEPRNTTEKKQKEGGLD